MNSSADERRPILTLWQILLLVFAPAVLFPYAVYILTQHYFPYLSPPGTEYRSVLWTTEAGLKMLVPAWLLVPIGELILVVHFIICNRLRSAWRDSILVGVTLLVLATCFAPAVVVFLVGPPIAERVNERERIRELEKQED